MLAILTSSVPIHLSGAIIRLQRPQTPPFNVTLVGKQQNVPDHLSQTPTHPIFSYLKKHLKAFSESYLEEATHIHIKCNLHSPLYYLYVL